MFKRILFAALVAVAPTAAFADCVSDLLGSGINPLAAQNICDVQGTLSTQNLTLTGTAPLIATNTVDAADNKTVVISGGGANGVNRGARVILNGNEVASVGGTATLQSGNAAGADVVVSATDLVQVSGANIELRTGGAARATVNNGGVDITGELSISGVPTASGVLCRKADGDIGQCTSVVAAGGTCTCG
jgi:hypothetical protein